MTNETRSRLKFRILFVFGFVVWVVCSIIQIRALAFELQDSEAALLVTRANISELDRGYVLGYFPNVVVTSHKLNPKLGYFVFDSEKDSTVEKSNFIQFEIQSDGKYQIAATDFISALRWQIASLPPAAGGSASALPEKLYLTSPNNKRVITSLNPKSFSKGDVARWFLLKGESEKRDDKEVVRLDPVTSSILIQIGTRQEIEQMHGQVIQEQNRGGASIYTRHFNRWPLSLAVIKESIGRKDSIAGEVEGISLVSHIQEPSGNIVMAGDSRLPLTQAPKINMNKSKDDKDQVEFDIDAAAFIKNIIEPALEPEDPAKRASKQGKGLECVIPDDEASQRETACKKRENQILISGILPVDGSKPKGPVVFWVQPKDIPTLWYRCELTLNPNVAITPKQDSGGGPGVSSPTQADSKQIERSKKKSGLE